MIPSPKSAVMPNVSSYSVTSTIIPTLFPSELSSLPQLGLKLQETVLSVQRLRVEHSMVVELSSKLMQQRLDLEQQLEDIQAMHKNSMEQMAIRGKHLSNCKQGEQLSGVGSAVIQDVKMLRQQFRQARQEVDNLEDQLMEMEVNDIGEKEATAIGVEANKTLEMLGKLLKYNMEQLEEEQKNLGHVIEAGREANNCLHQDRIMMGRLVRLGEEGNRGLEERLWEIEIYTGEGINDDIEIEEVTDYACDDDVEGEEERLEVKLGERLCELESVQNCLEESQKIAVQISSCHLVKDEGQVFKLELELKDMGVLWDMENKELEEELKHLRKRIDDLEKEKEGLETFLEEFNTTERHGDSLDKKEDKDLDDTAGHEFKYDSMNRDNKGEECKNTEEDIKKSEN